MGTETRIPECLRRRPGVDQVDRATDLLRSKGCYQVVADVQRIDHGEVWVIAAALFDATERAERAEARMDALGRECAGWVEWGEMMKAKLDEAELRAASAEANLHDLQVSLILDSRRRVDLD